MDKRSSDLHGKIVMPFHKEVMSKKERKTQRRKSEVKPSETKNGGW